MKNAIFVAGSTFFGLLALLIVMSIYGKMNRSMELQSKLPSMIEEALENDMLCNVYGKDDIESFINNFAKLLAASWENQSDMQIDVLQYEPEKGILSLKVTAIFKQPYGTIETVECERTVILNKVQDVG